MITQPPCGHTFLNFDHYFTPGSSPNGQPIVDAAGPSSPAPWAGVSTVPGQFSPTGVYDLPAVTPMYTAHHYNTRGQRCRSPII